MNESFFGAQHPDLAMLLFFFTVVVWLFVFWDTVNDNIKRLSMFLIATVGVLTFIKISMDQDDLTVAAFIVLGLCTTMLFIIKLACATPATPIKK